MIEVIDPTLPLTYNFGAKAKGEYLPYVVNPDGSEEFPFGTEMIPNIITNIGLDRWLTNADSSNNSGTFPNSISFCRVGSGNTAAAATDTQLQTQLTDPAPTSSNFTGTGANFSDLSNALTLGTATHTITKQFLPLVGASATINEIGLGWSDVAVNSLFSRVVLPSPLTITQGQVLRVVYSLTISIPQFLTVTGVSASSGFNVLGTAPNKGLKIINDAAWNFGSMAASGGMGGGTGGCTTANRPGGFIWPLIGSDNPTITFISCAGNPQGSLWETGSPWLINGITSFPALGVDPTGYNTVGNASTFISSSVTGLGAGTSTKNKDRIYEWPVTNPTNTTSGITGFKLGSLLILFDSSQEKSNNYRLRLTLRSSWARL